MRISSKHWPRLRDYILGPIETVFRHSTAIVDCTIEKFTPEGYAEIKINECIKGKDAPTLVKNVSLTCVRPFSVQHAGLEKGTRYVLILNREDLYEWSTVYAVRENEGKLECCRRGETKWIALDELKQQISRAIKEGQK